MIRVWDSHGDQTIELQGEIKEQEKGTQEHEI